MWSYHNDVPSGHAPWQAFRAQQLQALNGNKFNLEFQRNGVFCTNVHLHRKLLPNRGDLWG